MGTAGVVALVTLWLTMPTLLPIAKESSIDRAVKAGRGPSFWWPASWRAEYTRRTSLFILEDIVFDVKVKVWNLDAVPSPVLDVGFPVHASASSELPIEFEASRLAVVRAAPDFALIDQAGQPFHFSKLDGKVRLVSFIFTTCNGTCPATTHRLAQVRQELKSRGLLDGDGVHFVSITLDPERDTPEALVQFRKLYDIDSADWNFLTGPPADVHKVIDAWGMWVRPAANGQLDHPSRIFLVDSQSRVREIYNLSFLKTGWVADDVKLLLDESTSSKVDAR